MIDPTEHSVYLQRHDASRNMARFYHVEVSTDLFGTVLLSRRWGRIGTRGQGRAVAVESKDQAIAAAVLLERSKRLRGYIGGVGLRPREPGAIGDGRHARQVANHSLIEQKV